VLLIARSRGKQKSNIGDDHKTSKTSNHDGCKKKQWFVLEQWGWPACPFYAHCASAEPQAHLQRTWWFLELL